MKVAKDVGRVINFARRQAAQKGLLDPSRLVLSQFYVTKGRFGPKRPDFRARSHIGMRRQRTSHLKVSITEVPFVDGKKYVGKFARGINKARWQAYKAQKAEDKKEWIRRMEEGRKSRSHLEPQNQPNPCTPFTTPPKRVVDSQFLL
eukprot:TRINITY_DN653_c0_g1_i1.p1 TRINITY_DN653_c0_g1~~TRINITY_DN653_c0_g1_i1.p1  ORF type:complete len:147 (+),score=30.08 TRINITY_DN653_c0_g1_i1:461-901(+)